MKIKCPHCGAELEALKEHYGKVVECAVCGEDISVSDPQTPPDPPTPKSKDKIKITEPPKNKGIKEYIAPATCKYCKKEIPEDAKKCGYCGSTLNSFSLIPAFLSICIIVGFIAGVGFSLDSIAVAKNAKSDIHEIYGGLLVLQALVCLAGSFIILAIMNLKQP